MEKNKYTKNLVRLSKTKYLNGLQCKKLLWYIYNEPGVIPEPDEDTKAVFDQGQLVGDYAKKLFSGGVEVDHTGSFDDGLKSTSELIAKRVPVFEAALAHGNCYARADILEPVGKGKWNLIEVKSSTDLKEVYYTDIGFQYYLYTKAGLDIDKCYLMCIDNNYVRRGDIEPEKLLKKIDVTAEVKETYSKIVENNVAEMIKAITAENYIEPGIGPHCHDPYGCPLTAKCWSFLPERNVFLLYRNNKLPFALIKDGIYELSRIPETIALSEKNQIQINTEKTGKPHSDRDKIREFLDTIELPSYYIDFETWQSPIPMFDNSRPYQQIPFQFSVHINRCNNLLPEHHSFLADGTDDPRPGFMARLREVIGNKGSIIAFNASFEMRILKECAEAFPQYKEWVESLEGRIVDLLQPFRDFAYYHPKQDGSCSIKNVLPVLTGKSYNNMKIGDGGTASREYFRVTFTKDNEDKAKIRKLLEEYCALDTLGMVEIVERLHNLK